MHRSIGQNKGWTITVRSLHSFFFFAIFPLLFLLPSLREFVPGGMGWAAKQASDPYLPPPPKKKKTAATGYYFTRYAAAASPNKTGSSSGAAGMIDV